MKIFIGLPHYRGQTTTPCTVSLMLMAHALGRGGVQFSINHGDAADIAKVRNELASQMLAKTDCTHLLFWDDDMTAPPAAILRLIGAKKELVGVAAPVRTEDRVNVVPIPGRNLSGGINRVRRVGAGICLISRHCLETIRDGSDLRVDGGVYGFFDRVRDKNIIIGEDYAFCDRWTACGGAVFALVGEDIGHVVRRIKTARHA